MIRFLFLSVLLPILASCTEELPQERPPADIKLLATDVHISVAQHPLVLPFVAMDDYAYRKQSFSLDRKRDAENARSTLKQFLSDSADAEKPLELDGVSIAIRTFGWNDGVAGQNLLCPLLNREWARSICDNPWASIQQSLPANRFRLVDLSRLQIDDPRGPAQCRDDGTPPSPLPERPADVSVVCTAMVYGGRDDQFHRAVVRIDGDLGALWMVWQYGKDDETAEAMAEREGKAIVALVQYALGARENFLQLHADTCRLRRPDSADHPHRADCRGTAVASPTTTNR